MADIASILLIPEPDHREALLSDGPCGARVPQMQKTAGRLGPPWEPLTDAGRTWMRDSEGDIALVLAHDGKVVREGRDRAGQVLSRDVFGPTRRPMLGYGTMWSADVALYNSGGKRPSRWTLLCEEADAGEDFDLPPREDLADDLLCAWSLATVCAARGLGRLVLLDGDGREVAGG